MPLVNCEINLILTWPAYWVISSATGAIKFTITGTKLYVPVVTLLIQDAKLLNCIVLQFKTVLKEQLLGMNINQKYQQKDKTFTYIT